MDLRARLQKRWLRLLVGFQAFAGLRSLGHAVLRCESLGAFRGFSDHSPSKQKCRKGVLRHGKQ